MQPNGQGGSISRHLAPHSAKRSRWRRWGLIGYVTAVHLAVVAMICDPMIVVRVEAFLQNTPEKRPDYRGMVAGHFTITRSMPDGATVFLGDSRMRDLNLSSVGVSVYNLSIGGDTTRGLRSRLAEYARLDTSRLVVLAMGVNDLSHFTDAESIAFYEEILDQLAACGVRRVAVCAVLPVNDDRYQQANSAWARGLRTTRDRIAGYNRQLQAACERRTGVTYLDTAGPLTDPQGNLKAEFTTDGLHLSNAGSDVWVVELRRAINAIPE